MTTDRYETQPQKDPKQALIEAQLRWQPRGVEVVRDPQGRVK
jgi:hypothetical protein